jgi:hypothetical protein
MDEGKINKKKLVRAIVVSLEERGERQKGLERGHWNTPI